MATYYITSPVEVKAEVTAPSTRSARTTYLDYLTRNGLLPWGGRGDFRKSILIDRIESGQFPVDVDLDYRLESSSSGPDEEFELGGDPERGLPQRSPEMEVPEEDSEEESLFRGRAQPQPRPGTFKYTSKEFEGSRPLFGSRLGLDTKIGRISRQSFGPRRRL